MFKAKIHFHRLYKSGLLLVILTVGGLLLPAIPAGAFANSGPVVSGAVSSGGYSQSATAGAFTGTIGTTTTFITPIVITASDMTGSGSGWSLSISSTPLTDVALDVMPTASAMTISGSGTTASCTTTNTCSSASITNAITGPVIIPIAPASALKFFTSAASTSVGWGQYTVTPVTTLFVPATAKPGTYSATYTLGITVGP